MRVNYFVFFVICGLFPAGSAASAAAETLEELLESKGVIQRSQDGDSGDSIPGGTYYEGGLSFNFPEKGVSSKVNLLLQERYAYSDLDEDRGLENSSSFSTEEARLIITGSALYDEFRYMLETNFASHAEAPLENRAVLEDAYLVWGPCSCSYLKLGSFQTPYVRQQNNPDQLLHFVEKSLAAGIFDRRPQGGLLGQYQLVENRLSIEGSIFNGDSDGEGANRAGMDTKHLGFIQLRGTPLGRMDYYSDGDYEWTEDSAFALGALYGFEEADEVFSPGSPVKTDLFNADINFKYQGASLHAELMAERSEADAADDASPLGFYIEGGLFAVPRKIELTARYSSVDCDGAEYLPLCQASNRFKQTTAGINYYWNGSFKALLNYDYIEEDGSNGVAGGNSNRVMLLVSAFL